jgi:DNA-binding MurR/RpiR family transcriptional regulator
MMTPAPSFKERIAGRIGQMSPAEQRVASYFDENREEVLIASAAALAQKAQTSDATVVRAAKALGFTGLDELRRALAAELRRSLSPAERLTRTLGEVGGSVAAALPITLDIHQRALDSLRQSVPPPLFEAAVALITAAGRVVVFGLGPSAAIAQYLATQLVRFGLDAITLTHTGLLFADDLRRLRAHDLVVILAYGRVYAELSALLDEIARQQLRSCLITDTLAAALREQVGLVLPVARGEAGMLSMHTATLGFIEALLVGVAAKRPDETLAALRALNEARQKLAGGRVALRVPDPPPRPADPATPDADGPPAVESLRRRE